MLKNFGQTITKFHYKKLSSITSACLFLLFLLPSMVYSIIINTKNFLYKIKILKEKKVNAKIICIGNLTTGGVGKTPVTIEFCKYLSQYHKTASLSRGYGGTLKGANIVKNYEDILINESKLIGDEVKLLAESSMQCDIMQSKENVQSANKSFAVIASKDRFLGVVKAIDELGAEIIVMDDGFSNRKIQKDLSLLLFDSTKFIGNGFLLPLGPLREPVSEIKRANGIILIDKEDTGNEELKKLSDFLYKKFNKPVFISKFKTDYFYNIKTGKILDITEPAKIFAFSGIGQPEQFYNYIHKNPLLKLIGTKSYNDHYVYTKSDMDEIITLAEDNKTNYIITTEKDAVKIKDHLNSDKIYAMKLKADIDIQNIISTLNFSR